MALRCLSHGTLNQLGLSAEAFLPSAFYLVSKDFKRTCRAARLCVKARSAAATGCVNRGSLDNSGLLSFLSGSAFAYLGVAGILAQCASAVARFGLANKSSEAENLCVSDAKTTWKLTKALT